MKTLYTSLLIVVSAFLLVACEKEDAEYAAMQDPSSGGGMNFEEIDQTVYTAMGTLVRIEQTGAILLEQDNGFSVYVTNPDMLTALGDFRTGDRFFYTYRLTTQKNNTLYIYIVEAHPVTVLTQQKDSSGDKPLFASGGEGSSVGGSLPGDSVQTSKPNANDPVSIVGRHIAGHYLNLQYQYRTQESGATPHRFTLTLQTEEPDANGWLTMDFCHDANGNRQEVVRIGYASIALPEIPGFSVGRLKGITFRFYSLEEKQETIRLELE